jgi:hypothetical protein
LSSFFGSNPLNARDLAVRSADQATQWGREGKIVVRRRGQGILGEARKCGSVAPEAKLPPAPAKPDARLGYRNAMGRGNDQRPPEDAVSLMRARP